MLVLKRTQALRTPRQSAVTCAVSLLAAGILFFALHVSAEDAPKNDAMKIDEKGNVYVEQGTISSRGILIKDGTKEAVLMDEKGNVAAAGTISAQDFVIKDAATRTTVSVIPAGAVIAFNLEACPTGWTEYKPAYGRFIRGVDKSGEKIDPDGQRKPGGEQGDAIRNIKGTLSGVQGAKNRAWPWGFHPGTNGAFSVAKEIGTYNKYAGDYIPPDGVGHDAVFDASKVVPTAEENRPKNVSLLYCQKD